LKRQIFWTPEARLDLNEAALYVARDSGAAAYRLVDRVEAAANRVAEVPAGRPGRLSGTYEKLVPSLPYILLFRLRTEGRVETVRILRVVHKSRDWQPGTLPD